MTDNRIYFPPSLTPEQTPAAGKTAPPAATRQETGKFAAVLAQQIQTLKFSQHAQSRLTARNIQLSPADMARLGRAVEQGAHKGARDMLALLEQPPGQTTAFIVNVPHRTVVTALDRASMQDNVFTNIDSAVII